MLFRIYKIIGLFVLISCDLEKEIKTDDLLCKDLILNNLSYLKCVDNHNNIDFYRYCNSSGECVRKIYKGNFFLESISEDKKVRNGLNIIFNKDKEIKTLGCYVNDLKHGVWNYLDSNGVSSYSLYNLGEFIEKGVNELLSLSYIYNDFFIVTYPKNWKTYRKEGILFSSYLPSDNEIVSISLLETNVEGNQDINKIFNIEKDGILSLGNIISLKVNYTKNIIQYNIKIKDKSFFVKSRFCLNHSQNKYYTITIVRESDFRNQNIISLQETIFNSLFVF